MGAPAGFAGQAAIKTETTPGTAVTPDQFPLIVTENVQQKIARIWSKAIRPGRRTQAKVKAGAKLISGPIVMELPNLFLATWLRHMFGTVAAPVGSGPYTHTATPGTLTGKSFTAQFGRPSIDGTVQPFTYAGCKITDWELSADINALAMLTLNISAMSETTATALATNSTPAIIPFSFVEGSVTVAGSLVATVKKFSLKCDNGLAADRVRIGAATVREQLEQAVRTITGLITCDFESLTAYGRYTGSTEYALVLGFDNGAGDTFTITLNVESDGETPTLTGGADALLDQPIPFTAFHSTSDASAITAVLVNSDATST